MGKKGIKVIADGRGFLSAKSFTILFSVPLIPIHSISTGPGESELALRGSG